MHDQMQRSAFAFKFFFKRVVGHNGAEYKSLLLPARLVCSKQNVACFWGLATILWAQGGKGFGQTLKPVNGPEQGGC